MGTHVKLIDLTHGELPCLLGHNAEELLRGLPELSASPALQSPSPIAGEPVPSPQLRAMLSFINPTFNGGDSTWVGIGKAILHGQLPVTSEINWEELLDDWCSGALWRERTGDDAFVVPTYRGREELLSRLSDAPRTAGRVIGLGTIIKLAKQGGYVGSVSSAASVTSAASSDSPEVTNEIRRLAVLPPVAYDLERETVASRLGCRVSTLDEAVKKARLSDDSSVGQGRALELHDPEPWPEPVSGADLLDALAASVQRHVVMDQELSDSLALWVLAAYCFNNFMVFPRLAILSPEKQCGKTTTLDVLSRLVPRALGAANITAAAVFRTIEVARPTLLIDEADSFLQANEELRGVLNSGHRRDGSVIRCVGDDAEPRVFSTWSPAAIAAIGRLPGTLEDRAILIGLRRRLKDEPVERLRLDRTDNLAELGRKAARWAIDTATSMGSADPAMPVELFNRSADNWRPLLAIADIAGGAWPQRARRAAVASMRTNIQGEDQSTRVGLLSDLKALFDASSTGALFSEEIINQLVGMEDRAWAEYSHGKPISRAQLAKLLKPFGVSPATIRRGDRTAKGYKAGALADAFVRYLSDQAVTPSQAKDTGDF